MHTLNIHNKWSIPEISEIKVKYVLCFLFKKSEIKCMQFISNILNYVKILMMLFPFGKHIFVVQFFFKFYPNKCYKLISK